MTLTFPAIVEEGRLRPVSDVSLPEGAKVIVTISSEERPKRDPAAILARIAALPLQGTPTPDAATNHDRYIYGGESSQ